MTTKIENIHVFNTEKRKFEYGSLCYDGARIVSGSRFPDAIIDGGGGYLLPGLIDVHTHGRIGIDIMDADAEALSKLSRAYAKSGVTTVYPTVMTAPLDKLTTAIDNIKHASTVADFAGIHIEGPYISAKKPGCHTVPYIREPKYDELEMLYSRILPMRTHLTVAPEEDKEEAIARLTERFKKCGGTMGIGHSNATFEICKKAIENGACSFTHTFNAMTPIGHREPGVAGAALILPAYAELICDGIHVAPEVISMAYHAKKHQGDKFVLITDSIPAAGLPDGDYEMNGIAFTLKDGKAATPEDTIVGSALDLFTAVKNLAKFADIPFAEALICATKAPAEMVGLYDSRGSLAPGKRADMLLCDENMKLKNVIIEGRRV